MTEVYFKQLLHELCGCSSYIVGGRDTNEVAVIDPGADCSAVNEALALHHFRVRYVIDTHIHADHLSGARALAEASGAALCMHESADVCFPFRPLRDGETLTLGNVELEVLHTPGHRPEAICLLVTNHARGEAPSLAISGDTLLVGDVGRPDLGGERGAEELWRSLQRLLALDDYVELFPGHFDGPCGKGICGRPSSTIGFERRFNPMLQIPDRAAFVQAVTAELPPRPLNMDAIVATNRGERSVPRAMLEREVDVPEIEPEAAPAWIVARRAVVLDVREPHEYAGGHLPGALHLPQSALVDRLAELPRECELLVVCRSGARSLRCAQFLRLQGYERVTNLRGGTLAWAAAGLPLQR